MNTKESFSNSICKEQMQMAEREFSAFISAVKELLGPEQAQLSAVDWLDELELMDGQPASASRHWRAVTIAASARLANRLNAGPHDRSFAEDVVQYVLIPQERSKRSRSRSPRRLFRPGNGCG